MHKHQTHSNFLPSHQNFIMIRNQNFDGLLVNNIIPLNCNIFPVEYCRYLILYLVTEKNVSLNVTDMYGMGPLHIACSHGHVDTIVFLLRKKVCVEKLEIAKMIFYNEYLMYHLSQCHCLHAGSLFHFEIMLYCYQTAKQSAKFL